jgi:uncharacterized protein
LLKHGRGLVRITTIRKFCIPEVALAEPIISDAVSQNHLLKPTSPDERIQVIDSLRGFAILGILMVNTLYFSMPVFSMMSGGEHLPGTGNNVAMWIIRFFSESKFYSLFSLLFGLGAGILYSRALAKERKFAPFYGRRLFILLLIGLFHAILLWSGDILVVYAVLGFLLLLFEKAKPRTMLIWFFIFAAIPLLITALSTGAIMLWKMSPGGAAAAAETFGKQNEIFKKLVDSAIAAYSGTNWFVMIKMRIKELTYMYRGIFFYGWNVLSMFVLGLWFWRTERFQKLEMNQNFFRNLMWVGLILGIAGNLVYAGLRGEINPSVPTPKGLMASVGITIGAPALCLFYLSLITRLSTEKWGWKLIKPLSAVGRTALSNYLLQTLVFTTVFNGYGFGLYGKVGPVVCLGMTFVMYVIQVFISNWWVRHYRFGPAEWLWRSLTYGKRQPMKLPEFTTGSASR